MKKLEIEIDKKYDEKIVIEETEKGTFFICLSEYINDMSLEIQKEHIEKLKKRN